MCVWSSSRLRSTFDLIIGNPPFGAQAHQRRQRMVERGMCENTRRETLFMPSLFKTLHPVSLMPRLTGGLKLVPSPQSLYRADIFAWITPSDSATALPVTMHNVGFSTRATLVISSFIRAKNFLPCGWLHLDCNCMYLQTRFHVPRQNSRPFPRGWHDDLLKMFSRWLAHPCAFGHYRTQVARELTNRSDES